MQNLYNKQDIVDWILATAESHNEEITPKKLQKLLYYVYSWGLVFLNETSDDLQSSVFNGNFQAWVHGPVDPEVYHQYSEYGYRAIDTDEVTMPNIGNEIVIDVLQQVWDTYSQFNANQLENLTHTETPWQEKRNGYNPLSISREPLSDVTIFNYYGVQLSE
ncbi:DUF4065 domain-containing protein [Weissella paramesenteroides]|nr:DUF4065 domain-containing protein [Weissella paramesenteroides]KAA8438553.1 DUF4065 domain-containing protein [Weissella paramesenteroides]